MRSGLALVGAFGLVSVLFASDAPQGVKWGVLIALAALSALTWKRPLTRDERLRRRDQQAWKEWRATVPADDLPAIEDAMSRGVAAPPRLRAQAVEAARLMLGEVPGRPAHETEFGRRRGFGIALTLGGAAIVMAAVVASRLGPGVPVPDLGIGAVWLALGPIFYLMARHREQTVRRALQLNADGDGGEAWTDVRGWVERRVQEG